MLIPSSDHVGVAVHEFGGSGGPLLLSHATGFHAYCYLPLADALADEFTGYGIDLRGHGDTARPDDWHVDWTGYGDDAEAAARAIAPEGGLIGFGHSMGAAALLMASQRNPGLFDAIVAFEPIVFPSDLDRPVGEKSPLVGGARRRRSSFPSFEAALENYSGKPPMQSFEPDVLRLYVAHGFRAAPEGVRLKCDPEHEARTFEQSLDHPLWELLPKIDTRVVVIGSGDEEGAATIAPRIADHLPNARFLRRDDWDHFGPFVDPTGVAKVIADTVSDTLQV